MFEKQFNKMKSEIGIVSTMAKLILTKLSKNSPNCIDSPCQQHFVYMIKILLTIRIFKECKWQKRIFS